MISSEHLGPNTPDPIELGEPDTVPLPHKDFTHYQNPGVRLHSPEELRSKRGGSLPGVEIEEIGGEI